MTEHLPECPTDWCICSYLRACEQRVEEMWSAIAGRDQYAEGYTAALSAAREAVAAIAEAQTSVRSPWELVVVDDAVAAIDALRESK